MANITGISFLNGGGGQSKFLVSTNNKDRIEDLAFIRISCTINSPSRKKDHSGTIMFIIFYLKLHQSSYSTIGDIPSIDTPVNP